MCDDEYAIAFMLPPVIAFPYTSVAVKILKGEAEPASMPVEKPSQYDYAINGEVATELGIEIPADLQDSVIQPQASPAQ